MMWSLLGILLAAPTTGEQNSMIWRELEKQGVAQANHRLEPWRILTERGAEGAFEKLSFYVVHDKNFHHRPGGPIRSWRPVVVIGPEVLLGPSKTMLSRILETCGFYEQPQAFQDPLLSQLHNFSLEFLGGWALRVKQIERSAGQLKISGQAQAARQRQEFVTLAVKGQALSFELQAQRRAIPHRRGARRRSKP